MQNMRVLLLALLTVGCDGSAAPQPGRAYFPQRQIDLGEIPVTSEGRLVQVPVRNVGAGPLTITKIVTSCGCTRAGDFSDIIPAGGDGAIPLRITTVTPGKGGSSVTVSTNMPHDMPQVVELQWTAVASIEADPLIVDFGNILPGSTHQRTVSILRRQTEVVIRDCSASPVGRVIADLSADSVAVSVLASDELGSYSGVVTASVEGAWPPEIRIPVHWTVRDLYDAAPKRLFLGQVVVGQNVARKIVVTSLDSDKLRSITAYAEGIDGLETRASLRSESCAIVEVMWSGSATEGAHAGTIVVDVTGSETRTLRVPVSAFVAAATAHSSSDEERSR